MRIGLGSGMGKKGKKKVPLICNPAKGKVQPVSKIPRKENYTPRGIYLVYDPIGKQFKVLCLTLDNSLYSRPNYNTHWILTLESGKRLWRKLEAEFSFKVDGEIHGDICINGVLYFKGRLNGSFVIVCFEVRSEKFSFINKLDEDMLLPKPSDVSLALFNYRDKLGIFCLVEQELVLWVLEDAGNHKLSKHIYVSSHLLKELEKENKYGRCTLVGMTGTGEIVCSSESSVFFHNIQRNTFKRIYLQGLEGLVRHSIFDTFVDYVENFKFM